MTRRTSANPTKPVDPKDKRTAPQKSNPLKPRTPRKKVLSEEELADPAEQKYQKVLVKNQRNGARRTRTAQRKQSPTRKLPPICACPLDKPIKAGSDQDWMTPREIKMYGIEETYLSICTRPAGQGTMHPRRGYCDDCEERTRKKTDEIKSATGRVRRPSTQRKGVMTPAQIRQVHSEVMYRRDVMGQPVDIGPHEALLDEVQRTAGAVAYFEMLIKDLGRAQKAGDEHLVLRQITKLGIEPSYLTQLLQWERDHLIQASKAAIACGVAERRVRIQEDQGRMIVMVLQAFIYDQQLGLTPGQLQIAPQIMRKHMLALPSETNPGAYLDSVANGTLPSHEDTIVIDVDSEESK